MLTDAFTAAKSNLELSDSFRDTIAQRHNAVRSVLANLGKSGLKTKLIGSLQRQTRIHPRPEDVFDIDILVEMGSFYSWLSSGGVTPQQAMNEAHQLVGQSDRYRAMAPVQDHPTVTFSYADDVKVELVPAYRDNIGRSPAGTEHGSVGRGYWVPNSAGNWELADYDHEADHISALNRSTNGMFIPLVKMLKAMKRQHFPAMKSYHLEVIAAHVMPIVVTDFERRNVPLTYPNLITGFLHQADNFWFANLRLPGSNSPAIAVDQLAQVQIADILASLKEASNRASTSGTDNDKQRIWRDILGDVIPAV